MKSKTELTIVLFSLTLLLILFSGAAWGGIISCPADARVGQLIEVVADAPGTWFCEGPATTAIYTDPDGTVELGAEQTASMVYWRLPLSISSSFDQYTIIWTSADGAATESPEFVNVYSHVIMEDQDQIEPIYYPGLTQEITASGGMAPYTWTVIGPDLQPETVITDVLKKTPFEFVAPSTGEFAGIHTAWVSDALKRVIDPSLTGTALEKAEGRDNLELYEFAWLDGKQFFIEEDAAPVTYTLTGAPTHPMDPETQDYIRDADTNQPISMTYSFKIMAENTENSTEYTGLPAEYGYVTLDNGNVPVSGTLVITYHPPANPSAANTFWIRGNASEKLMYSVGTYEANIYDVWLGPITLRLKADFTGVVVDQNKNPLDGVEILLLAPTQYQTQIVTGEDGEFTLSMTRGQRYYFQANLDGYVSRYFASSEFNHDGGSITLEEADPQNHIAGNVDYTPGTGNLEDGEIVTISLVDYNQAPAEILAETKVVYSNTKATVAYRLDIGADEILPGQSYALIAYAKNYSCTKIFRISDSPTTGYQLPMVMNLDMKEFIPPTTSVDATADPIEYEVSSAELAAIPQTQGATAEETTAPTALGGIAFDIRNSDDELRFSADFRPGFADTSVLSNTSTVKIIMESEKTPLNEDDTHYLSGYYTYAGGSQRILRAIVRTDADYEGNANSKLVNDYGTIMTIPFDLLTVEMGDFESGLYYVRKGEDRSDLATEYADDVPLSDILAIDYLGDGETGWVTFKAKSFSYYGVGQSESTTYAGAGSYKWADFERYELWGCFADSLKNEQQGSHGLLILTVILIAGCLAVSSRGNTRHGRRSAS